MEDTKSLSTKASLQQKLSDYYKSPISFERSDGVFRGEFAWLLLVFGIIVYEVFAIKTKKAETLTKGFWRSTNNKVTGFVPVTAWMILTLHLILEKRIRQKINQ